MRSGGGRLECCVVSIYRFWVSLLLLMCCCFVLAPVWLVHKYLRCMGEELRIGTEENDLLHLYFCSVLCSTKSMMLH